MKQPRSRVGLLTLFTLLITATTSAAFADGLVLTQPVDGPVVRGFAPGATKYSAGHRGVDLASLPGSTVRAAAQGVVHFAGSVAGRSSVSIDHGGVRTTYTPVRASVRQGEVVEQGQPIGILQAGHCPQGCLHFGLTNGDDYFDPLSYLAKRKIRLVPIGTLPVQAAALPAAAIPILGGQLSLGKAPVGGPVTSIFGMRVHPVTGVYKLHDGVDFGARCGTSISSPWEGVVAARDVTQGYGHRVHVEHANGLITAYAHLPRFDVELGQRIAAGQQVGVVGNTGYSTGCHLHWMAWRHGKLIDPLTLLR